MRVRKIFGLAWLLEAIEDIPGYFQRAMFGGLAAYLDDQIVLVIMESPGQREYKGIKSPFDLWNGAFFPVEREQHANVLKAFPQLVNHPVLPKWLYIPLSHPEFEAVASEAISCVARRDPRFGVVPKKRSPRKKKKK